MKLPLYTETLPEGYKEVFQVDASNKKLAITMNVVAAVPLIAAVIGVVIYNMKTKIYDHWRFLGMLGVFYILLLVYMVGHELTHGVVYSTRTHKKLSFGFNATVAWCGVKDVYVSRKVAIEALAAPLVVFTIVFGLGILLSPGWFFREVFILLLASHWGGCVGDIYDLYLLYKKFPEPELLMFDTGPTQTFYLPSNEANPDHTMVTADGIQKEQKDQERPDSEDDGKQETGSRQEPGQDTNEEDKNR